MGQMSEATAQFFNTHPEAREKMRETVKALWDNPDYVNKVHARSDQMGAEVKRRWQNPAYKERVVRAILKAMHVRPTAPERQVQTILDAYFPGEWRYVGDGKVILGGKNPDFVNVNGRKAVVEVFGDYWHSEKITGVSIDQHVAERIAHFVKYGFRCAVIWEHEVADESTVLARVGTLYAGGFDG